MNQTFFVRVAKRPCNLNGDVEDSECPGIGVSFIQPSFSNPVVERATFDKLGKQAWNTAEAAQIITTGDVGMQAKVHPSFSFALKIFLLLGCLKKVSAWGLHGQFHVPLAVIDAIDHAHATTLKFLADFVPI